MIQGAIEVATPTVVAGWLYSARVPLQGEQVLAFVGHRCVGAGRIDIPRADLREAGLGDGTNGFRFPVSLSHANEAALIEVRLVNCDMSLRQRANEASGVT